MRLMLAALLGLSLSGAALAQEGDAALGEKAFRKCKACHDAEKPLNKVGPHLIGIVGRPIGSVEGFAYSPAMLDYGAANGSWDEGKLAAYLAAPREVVPDTKMAFAGVRKPDELANIIAYLKTLAPAP